MPALCFESASARGVRSRSASGVIRSRRLRALSDQPLLCSVLDASDEGMAIIGPGAQVLFWNRAAAEILGHPADEMLGRSLQSVLGISPESTVGPFRSHEARDAQGRLVRLSLKLTALHEPELEGGWLCSFRREPLSKAPSWHTERLNLVLAAAELGEWTWDASSDRVTLSERAAEVFGVVRDSELTWTGLRSLLHPDDRERARLAVEAAISGASDYSIEYRVQSGGRERWVAASGRSIRDEHGVVSGMYGVVQDVSSYRLLLRVDDAVRPLVNPEDIIFTAARLLGQSLDVNRCAYATVDADEDTFALTGNYTSGVRSIVGTYRFRQFGAECLRLMRAGQPYVVSDSTSDPRIDPDDLRAYRQTTIVAVICVPILKSGRFVAAMAVHTAQPRNWSAREVELVQQVASRCWESLERARIEREREALLHAAEAANRAKDEFLAMLGHELRNPLAPIQTALELMRLNPDAKAERERTVIERQVVHLTRLVDDLLDVSRIARGGVALKPELVEIAEVVRHAVELASPLLEQRAHALHLEVPSGGLVVLGDIARLIQIVSNLLNNAGKYTPPGGQIAVHVRAEEQHVVLSVRDTGVGIAPEVLPRVFDLFVQARQTIERAQGGLGLGLTIVKNLVESHGGEVSAHSAGIDQGSEFVVRLPRATGPAPERHAPDSVLRPPSAIDRQLRVLIVDDNEDAAELLGTLLVARGYRVRVAHDGPSALQLAQAQPFDVALLDIGLPVMDGYELATRLKELANGRRACLIAVTGYGQPSDRERSHAAGFDHHLIKPVDISALSALLSHLQA